MSDDPDACPKPRLEEACKALCSKYVVAYQVREERGLDDDEKERESLFFLKGKGSSENGRKGGGRLLIEIEMAARRARATFLFAQLSRRRRCVRFFLLPSCSAELETFSRLAWRRSRVDSGPERTFLCKKANKKRKTPLARSTRPRRPRPPPLSLSKKKKNFLSSHLQACSKRIEGKADAHCTGQFFDMWHCIDKCVAPRLMPLLK